jgi:hypothetical protein
VRIADVRPTREEMAHNRVDLQYALDFVNRFLDDEDTRPPGERPLPAEGAATPGLGEERSTTIGSGRTPS